MILSQDISIEEKRIEAVKAWPKVKSIKDIQVFLGFANLYWRFIQEFSKIAMPLTSILKTTTSSFAKAKKIPKAPGNSDFLTSEAKLVFLRLRQAFTEAPILYYFDLECYIWI